MRVRVARVDARVRNAYGRACAPNERVNQSVDAFDLHIFTRACPKAKVTRKLFTRTQKKKKKKKISRVRNA